MAGSLEENLNRHQLAILQGERLRALLDEALPRNQFYARKLAEAGLKVGDIHTPADLVRLPFTTKAELIADQEAHPPFGHVLTYPRNSYSRMHQTSGTAGRPLRWLDTPTSWNRLLDCWEVMYRIMGLGPKDRLFAAFSFGPYLGFWSAFEAATRLGNLTLPGGGMGSAARLRFLMENEITVVLCTPTYALRLAEVAQTEGIDLAASPVRALVVAGEPGGSIAETRKRIEAGWGARVFDHNGMTEVGPVGIECAENPGGIHIMESFYLIEVIDPQTEKPLLPGRNGELVLSSLVRWGSPLLRYRTGDLVSIDPEPCRCGRSFVHLDGGILGRTDDMIHVRGNNLYPSTLEAVLRRFPEVVEYRVEVDQSGPLAVLRIAVEPTREEMGGDLADRVGRAIRDELLFRAEVTAVSPGSLPRFEMKSRRVVRLRNGQNSLDR